MSDRYIETLLAIHSIQQKYLYSPKLEELSDNLGVTAAGISLRIKRMEEEGWVERLENRALRITREGYDVINQTAPKLD